MLRHMTSSLLIVVAPSSGAGRMVQQFREAGNQLYSVARAEKPGRQSTTLRPGGERLHQEIPVGPMCSRRPARALCQQAERLDRVLVAVLGVNGLAGCELDNAASDVDLLLPGAHQMHLDAPALAFVERPMAERIEIEIGGKLAIEAHEQIEVELRGHALGVVISSVENAGVLDEIDADDEGCA